MRLNEPVTDQEVVVPEDTVLVSGTDTGGRIRFANAAFVAVSGFATAELEGAPHNLVRHPHMPQAAFRDLWATIKAGRPWEGLVKNRCKNGGFYWVRANVTPMVENGQVTGYVSIRTRPGREEVAAAEAAYAHLRQGGRGFGLRDGELVRTGWQQRLRELGNSVTGRLAAAGAVTLAAIGLVGWLGMSGMAAGHDALRTAYEDRMQPAMRLAEIRDLGRDALLQVSLLPAEIQADLPLAQRIAAIRSGQARIQEAWSALAPRLRSEEEGGLARRLAEARQQFWREGLEPALAIAERRDGPALRAHLQERLLPLFASADQLDLALAEFQAGRMAEAYAGLQAEHGQRLWLVPAAGLGGLLLLGGLGLLGFAGQRSHLRQLETELMRITRGELKGHIHTPPAREFRPVVALLRAMRARIAYAEQERAELDRRAGQERAAAVREMADKVEDATRSAVDEVAQRTAAMAAQAAEVAGMAERLGGNATAAAESAGRALDNTQAVAAATEQLSASIREIAGQTAHAAAVVARAVAGGRAAESTIATLAQAAGQVQDVVRLIGDVAARTNLLALNATIEAARAGEAGKGFAVVASEVKQLAAQTARATEDISRQLSGIQSATEAAVRAVSGMGQAIDEISGTAGAIAAAVEQQGAATQEIARNVAGNGEEVRAMAGRIEAVAADAAAAGARAVHMRDGSGEVDRGVRGMRQDLLQVVRTSMPEADRRREPRHPVSEPCLVEANGQRLEGSLLDISAHGALAGGMAAMPAGTRGTLHLPRRQVQIACEVRGAGPRGLHLRLEEAAITDAYRRAFEALTGTAYPPPRDRAA